MAVIDQTIVVNVPLRVAYEQWAQFEDFPRFMEGVEQVHQLNDATLEWRTKIGGVERSGRTRIVEQVPDQRITWIATGGARNDGTVSFSSLGATTTCVNLLLDVDAESPAERGGAALERLRMRVHGDLERFRDLAEAQRALADESDGFAGNATDRRPDNERNRPDTTTHR